MSCGGVTHSHLVSCGRLKQCNHLVVIHQSTNLTMAGGQRQAKAGWHVRHTARERCRSVATDLDAHRRVLFLVTNQARGEVLQKLHCKSRRKSDWRPPHHGWSGASSLQVMLREGRGRLASFVPSVFPCTEVNRSFRKMGPFRSFHTWTAWRDF